MPELWPQLLAPQTGLVGRAFTSGRASLTVRDLRDFGKGIHRQVDDSPFGGGAGMVLAVAPLHMAIQAARARTPGPVVLLSPRGRRFDQHTARRLAQGPGMTLICGRYEGMDERVHTYIDEQVSLGDFVLSAGDPAAFAIVDATIRLRHGVLGNPASLQEESFSQGLLEYPQYTRPAVYAGQEVPAVLRGGDHKAVAQWRRAQAEAITAQNPPGMRPEG